MLRLPRWWTSLWLAFVFVLSLCMEGEGPLHAEPNDPIASSDDAPEQVSMSRSASRMQKRVDTHTPKIVGTEPVSPGIDSARAHGLVRLATAPERVFVTAQPDTAQPRGPPA